jgi:hypothetical protein
MTREDLLTLVESGGQVTTRLRQLGAAATSTDLVTFYRERRIPG